TLMRQPAADADVVAQARQALGADGVPVEVINDSPGFVIQRLIASVVNLGCEIAQKGIATPDTLDRAIQLALGYPKGPLGFGEHYGKQAVLTVLNNMQAVYGEPRYRPSPPRARPPRRPPRAPPGRTGVPPGVHTPDARAAPHTRPNPAPAPPRAPPPPPPRPRAPAAALPVPTPPPPAPHRCRRAAIE